jgi:SPP1 family predicted phage head-tail adaptor
MIGTLNQRASVLARTQTPDGAGGNSESWNAVANVWCGLAVIGGNEAYAFDAEQSRVQYRVTLRRTDVVSAGNHLAIGERMFRLVAVEDDGAATMSLICEELP